MSPLLISLAIIFYFVLAYFSFLAINANMGKSYETFNGLLPLLLAVVWPIGGFIAFMYLRRKE